MWLTALLLSVLLNAAILGFAGFAALRVAAIRPLPVASPDESAEPMLTILAPPAAPPPAPAAVPAERRFARTAEDQAATASESAAFIGERNTRATSDRTPDTTAPPLPAQAGIEPRFDGDIETTESDYQDGRLNADPASAQDAAEQTTPTPPMPETPATRPAAAESVAAEPARTTGTDAARSVPPPREKLLEGPNPVDVQVPRETAADETIKPTPEKRPAAATEPREKPSELDRTVEAPKPKPSPETAFKGYQRKTAITGSISRTGRSALDVEDTPLGRYQATISRAVELEWQRNCVRHRDFITPGFLTVRFFVEPAGRVRSVQFVGDMETGEVQKGFTLNSIRDADIPPMPPALRREHAKEPLELVFRFYF